MRNGHHAQFPLTDNLMSLVFLVQAGLNENQRARFVTSIMAQYTYLQVKQLNGTFLYNKAGLREVQATSLANRIPLVYMTLPPTNVWIKLQVKPYSKLYHVHCLQTYIPWQLGPQLAANYQRLWEQSTNFGKGRGLGCLALRSCMLVHRTGIPKNRT